MQPGSQRIDSQSRLCYTVVIAKKDKGASKWQKQQKASSLR